MNDIENIQNQLSSLQEQLDNLKKGDYDWDNAPIICELNGFKWLLGPEAPNELNWYDAIEWCKSIGGELPPRDILLHCYMNDDIKKEFSETYYWSSTEIPTIYAWSQRFNGGGQPSYDKTTSTYVRVVKKLQIY